MRLGFVIALTAACSSSAKFAPTQAVATTALVPFARLHHPAVLVHAPDRAILSFADAWFSIDIRGFHSEPDLAKEITRISEQIGGDSIRIFIGRTPIVAGTDSRHPQLARPGDTALTSPPGIVVDVAGLGDQELWQYRTDTQDQLALVDRAGIVRPVPPLDRIGADDPRPAIKPLCASSGVDSISPIAGGVAALIVECNADTMLRVKTFRSDGSSTVQRLEAITKTGLESDDFMFAVEADGTPVLAGIREGRLAIARGTTSGTWVITQSTVAMTTFASRMTVDPDTAVWTNTLGAGTDGHDEYLLERDGTVVDLRDPDGHPLATHDFVAEAHLGIVAVGHPRGGSIDDPDWLLAEHPPAGPVRDLP